MQPVQSYMTNTKLFSADQVQQTITQSTSTFRHITDTLFNLHSLGILLISLIIALVLGRFFATILRRITNSIGKQVDKTQNLATVNKLRRTETLIVLSSAVVRIMLVIFALYFWWLFIHPHGSSQSTALFGSAAVLTLVLGGVASPILRDFAYGTVMMAEHWYGVGDHITIDPIVNGTGVVERVTLRSTKLRGVNGEVVWVHNQSIWAVHVVPKGVSTLAMEPICL